MDLTLKRRAAAVAVAVALCTGSAVLAGCGSSASSGDATTATSAAETSTLPANGIEKLAATEILTKSQAATKAASSVTVKGTITDGGKDTSIDLVLGANASEGTITTGGAELSTAFVDGKAYFKTSGDGWATLLGSAGGEAGAAGKDIADVLGDSWLMLPTDPGSLDEAGGVIGIAMATFSGLIQKDSLLEAFLSPSGDISVAGTGEVNGTPVVFLEAATGDGKLAIQTVGEPYPVQVAGDGADGSGEITFSNWNAPVDVTAPTDVVDIGELAKIGG